MNLTDDDKKELGAIRTAVYLGGPDRDPEDDVRWLLTLIDRALE